jgi:hypothetical protein
LRCSHPLLDANPQRRGRPRNHCARLPVKGGNQVPSLAFRANLLLPKGASTYLPCRNGPEHGYPPHGISPPHEWPRNLVWQPNFQLYLFSDPHPPRRGRLPYGNSTGFPLSHAHTTNVGSTPGTWGPHLNSNLRSRPTWPTLLHRRKGT